jgi:tetraacyldisaccharide 4'-kinase
VFFEFLWDGSPLPASGESHRPASNDSRQRFLALIRGESRGVGPTLGRFGLRLASFPYGLAIRLRNWMYASGWRIVHHATVPVVSVGNLTVGGTGKTPCVEYIAGFYRGSDRRVAILSRGYGSAGGRNDEALVLEENLPDVPHLQGADRVALARTAVEELESEVLVLDDGFQHRRLARDLDVVLIDVTEARGYGYLLPRGLMREPRSSLRRAGLVVLTRCDQASVERVDAVRREVRRYAPAVPVVETKHGPVELVNSARTSAPLDDLRARPVAAFCGIGNPEAFRRTLTDLGADIHAFRVYPDHHPYDRADVESLRTWLRALPPDGLAVTTQKDLVKLRVDRLGERPLWSLRIRLQVLAGLGELEDRLRGAALCSSPGITEMRGPR